MPISINGSLSYSIYEDSTMLFRKKINDLSLWKEKETTALLIDGARQVGKTTLIREFIKGFNRSIEIDFTKNAEALSLLLEIRNYEDFTNRLSIISPITLQSRDDVLFLDEIQYYYEARANRIKEDPTYKERYIDIITLAKEIADRGQFRLILSGSMLGTTLFSINLNPTGYLRKMTMYPMDFEEFLLASGIASGLIDEIKGYFHEKKPVPESLHEYLLSKFREYIFVGGFPKAVECYLQDKTLELTSDALSSIDLWYREDISKYSEVSDRLVILEMYDILASEITMKNKKFVKSHLDLPNFKNLDLKDRFLWLKAAGIAIPTYNVTNPVVPLKISQDNKIVKLFMGDVGLLTYRLFDNAAKRKLIQDAKGIDLGAIYENAVAELLTGHGYPPYFQSTKKRGEIDFIIESNLKVIPIEIKAHGPDKQDGEFSHPALTNLLIDHPEIKESWLFGHTNIRYETPKICLFPIYMIDFVARD